MLTFIMRLVQIVDSRSAVGVVVQSRLVTGEKKLRQRVKVSASTTARWAFVRLFTNNYMYVDPGSNCHHQQNLQGGSWFVWRLYVLPCVYFTWRTSSSSNYLNPTPKRLAWRIRARLSLLINLPTCIHTLPQSRVFRHHKERARMLSGPLP